MANRTNQHTYKRICTYSIEDILAILPSGKDVIETKRKYGKKSKEFAAIRERDFCGHMVKISSQRYNLFKKKGVVCASCGIEGKYFALETHRHGRTDADRNRYHFNLYAVDKDDNEVLMTKDHIVPIMRGGKNGIDNL